MKTELWSLEDAEQSALDIQFWKSEYMKRKATFDPDYKCLQKYIFYIHREWMLFIQEKYNCTGYLFNRYSSEFYKHLQRHFIYNMQGNDYIDNDINFSKEYSVFLSRDDINEILTLFFKFSLEYDYFIDDLTDIKDMEYILKNIDKNNLYQPLFHINKHYHRKFDEDVLCLSNIQYRKFKIKNYHHAEINTIGPIGISFNDEKENDIVINAPLSLTESIVRNIDFVITGQTLHEKFDLKGVHEEVCDHITWCLYERKRQRNIPLTEYEQNAVIKLYTKMANGEYYKNYRAARAIGLWLWDKRYRFMECTSNNEAVRALRKENLTVEHSGSDDRTLLRLLEKTCECIKKGEVLAINKQSGRKPRDKDNEVKLT